MNKVVFISLAILLSGCASTPVVVDEIVASTPTSVDVQAMPEQQNKQIEPPLWVQQSLLGDDDVGVNCQLFTSKSYASLLEAKSGAKDMARIELFKRRKGSQRVSATERLSIENDRVDSNIEIKTQMRGYLGATAVVKEEVVAGDPDSLYCAMVGSALF